MGSYTTKMHVLLNDFFPRVFSNEVHFGKLVVTDQRSVFFWSKNVSKNTKDIVNLLFVPPDSF